SAAVPVPRRDGLAARLVKVEDRNLGALGGEQPGDFLADIAAGAGDDRDLILELHRFPPRPCPPVTTCPPEGRQPARRDLEFLPFRPLVSLPTSESGRAGGLAGSVRT